MELNVEKLVKLLNKHQEEDEEMPMRIQELFKSFMEAETAADLDFDSFTEEEIIKVMESSESLLNEGSKLDDVYECIQKLPRMQPEKVILL